MFFWLALAIAVLIVCFISLELMDAPDENQLWGRDEETE